MPRGQPDFGAYASKEVSASISDIGELAARLGAINIYDKRGDVVDFDNFEEPILKWAKTENGGSIYLHSAVVKSGSQSCALLTSAGIGDSVSIKKMLNVTPSKRIGLEFSFGTPISGLLKALPEYWDGEDYYEPAVELDLDNHLLYVYEGALYTRTLVGDVGTLYYILGGHFFYTMKLVVDFETGKFVRIMFGRYEWDISTLSIFKGPDPSAPHLEFDIYRENTDAVARLTSIDDFIFTQAEP